MAKKRSRREIRAYYEKYAEDRFAAYELTDSENFDNRQKARNILRYQMRGYCFELPPACTRYGKSCLTCPHVKCRENESYDGEKWEYDYDPDINRFSSLFDNLQDLANSPCEDMIPIANTTLPKVDTDQPLSSLLSAFAGQLRNTAF